MKRAAFLLLAVVACGAVSARAEAVRNPWPFVILRSYGSYSNNVRWTERVLAAQARHPGLVDEIWFAGTDLFLAPPAAAAQAAQENLAVRERCRGLGIGFSFQDCTLNHGADGVKRPEFPEDAWAVTRDGKTLYGILCCTSPFAKDYLRGKAAAIVAALRPDSYWVDDDMRLVKEEWGRPFICFCDRCVKRFNAERGTSYTRATLLKTLDSPEASCADVRRAWCAFNGEVLGELAAEIRKARDAACPATRLGCQETCSGIVYDGEGWRTMVENLAGPGGRAGARPGGGYYTDFKPRDVLEKLVMTAREAARLGRNPACAQLCYEAENWPHVGAEKNPGAMMREAVLALSVGCDSLALYWGADQDGQEDAASDFYLDTLARWRPQFERTRDLYRGTRLGGVALYQGEDLLARRMRISREDGSFPRLAGNGVPLTVMEAEPDAFCLNADAVETLSANDLPRVFARPVLTDVEGFRALARRFPSLDVVRKLEIRDFAAEKAVATAVRDSGYEVFPSGLKAEGLCARLHPKAPDVRGFSRLTADPDAFGTALVPSAFGGKVVVAQYLEMGGWLRPAWPDGRRHAVLDALDAAVPGGMPVRLATDGYSVALFYSKRPDGSVAGVTLYNLGGGETPPLKLAVRGKGGEKIHDVPELGPLGVHVLAVDSAQSVAGGGNAAPAEDYLAAARAAWTVAATDCADRPTPGGKIGWVHVDGMRNVRDVGGWTGLKTGRAFRGTEPDGHRKNGVLVHGLEVTSNGLETVRNVMRVKTDLDLRGPGECPHPERSALGVDLVRVPVRAYGGLDETKAQWAAALRVFADPKRYPIYFHCWGGADRTGTLAMLLEGLCGVSECDLWIDYELTTFSGFYRLRSAEFGALLNRIKARPGETLADKFADFVERELGLAKSEVAAIRSNLADAGEGAARR